MQQQEIYQHTLDTITFYSSATKAKIAKCMLVDGIITRKKKEKDSKIYIATKSDESIVSYALKQDKKLVKYIERWEFVKNYKYSIEFSSDKKIEEILNKLKEDEKIKEFVYKSEYEELQRTIAYPSLMESETAFYLKFNLVFEGMDSNGIRRWKRNPAVIYIPKGMDIIELRFDSIENIFDVDRSKYIRMLISWLKDYLDSDATGIDLGREIDYIKKHTKDYNMVVISQDMKFNNGGEASIGIGKDVSKKLPFIDELRTIMDNYADDLEKVPALKIALDEYIYDIIELSSYPVVAFSFEDKKFGIKIVEDYDGLGVYLVQHLSSNLLPNIGEERMNFVTRFIIDIRNIIKEI